jgi:3-oxoacyl-[acyl-carrier protein] reductase
VEPPRPAALLAGPGEGALRAVATELATRGWNVAFGYARGRMAAEAFVRDLDTRCQKAVGLFGSPEEEGTGKVFVHRALEELGRIDALVIDAGSAPQHALHALDDRDLVDAVTAGLLGTHRLVRAAVRPLEQTGGRIVVVGRANGTTGALVAGALASWAAAVGEELEPTGVGVACVAVGLPGGGPVQGAGDEGVARTVLALLAGDPPAPGTRVDVAPGPLSSGP